MKYRIVKALLIVILFIMPFKALYAPSSIVRTELVERPLEALKKPVIAYEHLLNRNIKYKFGGNNIETGIDCSRLIQILIDCDERHSETIYNNHKDEYPELIFFKGRGVKHIGWMINDSTILHCSPRKGINLMSIKSNEYVNFYSYIRK